MVISSRLYRYHVHEGSLTLGDRAPSWAAPAQCLAAARDGMAEASDRRSWAAYRRWHAWAAAYLAAIEWKTRERTAALDTVLAATRRDWLWPARLPRSVMRHVAEGEARLGRELMADISAHD
jgi:hypothetical protein